MRPVWLTPTMVPLLDGAGCRTGKTWAATAAGGLPNQVAGLKHFKYQLLPLLHFDTVEAPVFLVII